MSKNKVPNYKATTELSKEELRNKLAGYLDRFKNGERSKLLDRRIKRTAEELAKRR